MTEAEEAEQACHDYIEWLGNAALRCSFEESYRQALIDELQRKLQCSTVKQIRDEDALYGCCREFWLKVPCAALEEPSSTVFPDCCKNQLF